MEGFGAFRDTLAREMGRGLPEVKGDVEKVLESTGGSKDVLRDIERS